MQHFITTIENNDFSHLYFYIDNYQGFINFIYAQLRDFVELFEKYLNDVVMYEIDSKLNIMNFLYILNFNYTNTLTKLYEETMDSRQKKYIQQLLHELRTCLFELPFLKNDCSLILWLSPLCLYLYIHSSSYTHISSEDNEFEHHFRDYVVKVNILFSCFFSAVWIKGLLISQNTHGC